MKKQNISIFVIAAAVLFFVQPGFGTPQNMPLYGGGLWVQNQIDISGTIGWYNNNPSSLPMVVGTQSTNARAINVGTVQDPAHTVAVVGYGGNPATVISPEDLSKFSAAYASDAPLVFPPVIVPTGLTNIGIIGGTTTIGAPGIHTGYQSSAINLTHIGDTITINGNLTLYVTGDISLVGHFSGIIITPGSSLALYAGGNVSGDDGNLFNNIVQDSKRLQIYGLSTCTNIEWHNDVDFYGTIYAPNADISMKNQCNFYGAVVANSFHQSSGGSFNYDASLVPEPATLLLLGLGGVMLRRNR